MTDLKTIADALTIREADSSDMARVAEIYAHYVASTTITFETAPPDAAEMAGRWRKVRTLGAPYLVAEVTGRTVGYAYAGAYRSRPAYARTVEDSIYLAPEWGGRGIGRVLLDRLIAQCRDRGFAQMIAVIAGNDNLASIRLHRACGFAAAGRLTAVGHKFGQWLDTTLMQRAL